MAGGHGDHHPVKIDPAAERWQAMVRPAVEKCAEAWTHTSMYERFRLTPQRTRQVIVWAFAVPVLTYEIINYTNNRWNLRGKRSGESLLRNPPQAAEAGAQ